MQARRTFVVAAPIVLVAATACDRTPTGPAPPVATVATLSSLTVNPAQVNGGSTAQGIATLSEPAPAAGTVVMLSSSAAAATVPASITIAAGATSGTFAIATTVVNAQTDITISATAGGVSRTATLRLAAAPVPDPVAQLALLTSRHDELIGGQNTAGTVTLSSTAPAGGVPVNIASDDPAVVVESVTIGPGAVSADFHIGTAVVTTVRDVRITATLVNGAALTMTMRLLPPPPPPPANRAPTANDDSYSTALNTQLLINAPGVLGNDQDPDGDSLTAELIQAPVKGGFSLGADGAFSYTPYSTTTAGTDTFRYRVSDGQATSAVATVTITVGTILREETFLFTGGVQEFTVPAGVTSISIEAFGASGGVGDGGGRNGAGAMVAATVAVSPGEVLRIIVGGTGRGNPGGGFNGGGAAGRGTRSVCGSAQGLDGGAGGGATEIRRAPFGLGERLIVAGGGGGGGGETGGGVGGNGGDAFAPVADGGGSSPNATGGAGATQSGPGAGGSGHDWPDGALGAGSAGGSGGSATCPGNAIDGGGGGGGGYFGGGGGEAGSQKAAGGGGGLSFPMSAEHFKARGGPGGENGSVVIRY